MGEAAGAIAWLLIPLLAPTIGWYLMRRRANRDPNADIIAGVSELQRFQSALNKATSPDDSDS